MEWKDSGDAMEDAMKAAFDEQKALYEDLRKRGIEELFTRILCAVVSGLGPHMDRQMATAREAGESKPRAVIPLAQYAEIARILTSHASKEILKLRKGTRSAEDSP